MLTGWMSHTEFSRFCVWGWQEEVRKGVNFSKGRCGSGKRVVCSDGVTAVSVEKVGQVCCRGRYEMWFGCKKGADGSLW